MSDVDVAREVTVNGTRVRVDLSPGRVATVLVWNAQAGAWSDGHAFMLANLQAVAEALPPATYDRFIAALGRK